MSVDGLLSGFSIVYFHEIPNELFFGKRKDSKYIFHIQDLKEVLDHLTDHYAVLSNHHQLISNYSTRYLDSEDLTHYHDHLHGKMNRIKYRVRTYHDGKSYFEIKGKRNTGHTIKERIELDSEGGVNVQLASGTTPSSETVAASTAPSYESAAFDTAPSYETAASGTTPSSSQIATGEQIASGLSMDSNSQSASITTAWEQLKEKGYEDQLLVKYDRITLYSKDLSEKITLDLNLYFEKDGVTWSSDTLVIAESKMAQTGISSFRGWMKTLHIRQSSFQ